MSAPIIPLLDRCTILELDRCVGSRCFARSEQLRLCLGWSLHGTVRGYCCSTPLVLLGPSHKSRSGLRKQAEPPLAGQRTKQDNPHSGTTYTCWTAYFEGGTTHSRHRSIPGQIRRSGDKESLQGQLSHRSWDKFTVPGTQIPVPRTEIQRPWNEKRCSRDKNSPFYGQEVAVPRKNSAGPGKESNIPRPSQQRRGAAGQWCSWRRSEHCGNAARTPGTNPTAQSMRQM